MRRRTFFVVAIVVASLLALTAGIALAGGQGGASLPTLTPTGLLAKVAEEAPKATAVSGDVAWTNDLLGGAALALPGGEGGPASLLRSGSGRLWHEEGKLRFESQGAGGDMVAVLNGSTAWVYSSQAGTATEYALPALPAKPAGSSSGGLPDAVDLPAKIQEMVGKLAPYATLTVTTGTVAGRESYTLVMTPMATNTLIGSVQAAFDGTTFLPLRVQVFATGDAEPVLEAGFTKVSYGEAPAGTFDFTPPADAKVEHTTLSMPPGVLDRMMSTGFHDGKDSAAGKSGNYASLTVDQAAAAAGFALAVPADPALPFKGAHVMTPPSEEGTSGSALGETPTGGMFGDAEGPLVVLGYGEGFGSVMVMETKVTDAQWGKLSAALAQVPLFGTPSPFGGHQVYQLSTRLGSIVAWRQGDVVVLVGGSVSRADLEAFVAGIHE